MGRAEKTPSHLLAPHLVQRIWRIPGYGAQMAGSRSRSLYEDQNAPSPAPPCAAAGKPRGGGAHQATQTKGR